MKSTTIALIAAFLADKITAMNGATITRARCTAVPYDDGKRMLDSEVRGSIRLSQKIKGEDAGPIKVWSNWRDIEEPELDEYTIGFVSDADCSGAFGPDLGDSAMIKFKGKSGRAGIRGEIDTDFTLQTLLDF